MELYIYDTQCLTCDVPEPREDRLHESHSQRSRGKRQPNGKTAAPIADRLFALSTLHADRLCRLRGCLAPRGRRWRSKPAARLRMGGSRQQESTHRFELRCADPTMGRNDGRGRVRLYRCDWWPAAW